MRAQDRRCLLDKSRVEKEPSQVSVFSFFFPHSLSFSFQFFPFFSLSLSLSLREIDTWSPGHFYLSFPVSLLFFSLFLKINFCISLFVSAAVVFVAVE
jgi:hypothetical protein